MSLIPPQIPLVLAVAALDSVLPAALGGQTAGRTVLRQYLLTASPVARGRERPRALHA